MAYSLLLVDDDPLFREEFCESFEEYDIVEAGDGEAAIRALKKPNEIEIAFLDEMMPDSRGTELLKHIKENYPNIKVVILTGYSSKDVALDALRAKADEYIEKPIDIEQTEEIISSLLNKKIKEGQKSPYNTEGKIERVKNLLAKNFDKKISLKDAADFVALSPKYLSRVFEEVAGTGFNDYKLKIKTEKAKEMLKKGYTVEQISDELGYQNPESFIRIFKKVTGKTPSRFRKAKNSKKKKKGRKKKVVA